MYAYLIRRFLLIIPTFIGISLVTFLIIQLAPGNPVSLRLQAMGGSAGGEAITAEVIEQTKAMYGLDKPVHEQYLSWLGRMVRLDFGTSFKDNRPVTTRIAETLPITLQLNLVALLVIYMVSIPLGVYSSTHRHTRMDHGLTLGMFLLYSLPSFWTAMLLMYFFGGGGGSYALEGLFASGFARMGMAESGVAVWLMEHVFHFQWFPISGFNSSGAHEWAFMPWLGDRAWHLALPVFCLSYAGFAATSRYMRAGMNEVILQDYIRTARAYGHSEGKVIYRYALRNALIPIITLLGEELPLLIGGSVIIESIFSIPGMGRLAFESILSRDYPLVMGVLSFTAMLTLFGLILSDILYAMVDPKIKFD